MEGNEQYLLPGEEAADLMNGAFVIQDPACFKFGIDAVLLAHYPEVRKKDRVLDLGTGNGVIPLIMSAVNKEAHFTGLEIQEKPADMARRSVQLSRMEDRIDIVNGDIKEAAARFGAASFSLITCNPPYFPVGTGAESPKGEVSAARHETLITLREIVEEASRLLKVKGRLAMVLRPARIPELLEYMAAGHLTPKRMRAVHPYVGKEANLVLIEAVKCGGAFFRMEAPLIVYEAPGKYTQEILRIYGMEQ